MDPIAGLGFKLDNTRWDEGKRRYGMTRVTAVKNHETCLWLVLFFSVLRSGIASEFSKWRLKFNLKCTENAPRW